VSGHSKWSTIKRKKGAADAKRGALFTRLGREISIAAREGGPDPESNFKLRLVIDKAKANNMPKENIERAIRRGAGLDKDAAVYEEITYEGYGSHGVAMLVKVLTDNRNRAVADVRRMFNRHGGSMAESGAVAWGFEQRGYIVFSREGKSDDDIFEITVEAGADDVELGEEDIEVYTAPHELHTVSKALQAAGLEPTEVELTMKPKTTISLGPKETLSVMGLVDALEELDDVQQVYSNLEISDEVFEEYAAVA